VSLVPESPLAASETRFRVFVDYATDAFFLHTDDLVIIDVNRQACESLGYSRDELIGMHPRSFDVGPSPATGARVSERVGEPVTFESLHRRKDGTVFPVEVRAGRFEQEKRHFRVSLVRDITERKRLAEERERTRLTGEIHDTLAQGLAMIVMQLADAEAKLGPLWAQAEKPLTTVRELAVESLAYARRSVNVLRPVISAGGVVRGIRDIVDHASRHFSGTIDLTVTGDAVLLPALVESALIGMAQQALTNAVRHSGANRIRIALEFVDRGAVRLVVTDEGMGFDASRVPPDAHGLLGMLGRAARAGIALTLVTEPGAGTEVVASWSPAVDRDTAEP
jgi:PAS domain S-box-containing protein